MTRIFEDSWKRIERAVVHANALKSEWEVLLKPSAFTTSIEVNADWTAGVVRSTPVDGLRNDMALELGEFFYQLRAALDAAIYQISVISEGIDPPSNENRVEFPICLTPEKFKKSTVNEFPFPSELRDWLESIQPYNPAEIASDCPLNRHLKVLHDCARKDRHRRLHIVAAVPTKVQWDFEVSRPGKITFARTLPADLLEGESQFLIFGISGFIPGVDKKIRLKTRVRVEIVVEDVPIPLGSSLGRELDMVLQTTQRVIQTFEDGYE